MSLDIVSLIFLLGIGAFFFELAWFIPVALLNYKRNFKELLIRHIHFLIYDSLFLVIFTILSLLFKLY